jgi:RNA polymerase sigma-70 factor (ECF subfamily)
MTELRVASSERTAPDDATLLSRVANGDNDSLRELYDRYARVVYGLSLRMLGAAELAEDVVQETFWRVWRRSGTFQSTRGQVSSWIFGIAHNLSIDELRRQRSRPIPVYDQEDRPVLREIEDERINVVSVVVEDERRRLITSALEQIPAEQREVIELAYFGGLSQSEISERLSYPVGTVKTRVRLGLQKLRDILVAQGFHIEDLGD